MKKKTKTARKSTKKKAARTKTSGGGDAAPLPDASGMIDARIKGLSDPADPASSWRGHTLARVRAIINQAHTGVTEEWKWSVPVWSHPRCGIICTGEAYKKAVKLTFARGALLADPSGLFNSSLEGNTRRAIDLHDGDAIDAKSLKAMIRAAIALDAPPKAAKAGAATRKK